MRNFQQSINMEKSDNLENWNEGDCISIKISAGCSTSCFSIFSLRSPSLSHSSDCSLSFYLSFAIFSPLFLLSVALCEAKSGDGVFLTFSSLSAGSRKNVPSVGLKGRLHQSLGWRKWIIRRQSGDLSVKEEILSKWKYEIFFIFFQGKKKALKVTFASLGPQKLCFFSLSFSFSPSLCRTVCPLCSLTAVAT